MPFFVYMVCCSDETYYIGSTNNIERRIKEHNTSKKGAHYTKLRRPVTLVHSEIYETLSEARKQEYALKKLTRKQKQTLIPRT